jgi:hypothetical protein
MRFFSVTMLASLGLLVTKAALAGAGVEGEVTIPEPATIALFAAGAAGVLLLRRHLDKNK